VRHAPGGDGKSGIRKVRLFISQRIDRICSSCFDGLIANGAERDAQCQETTEHKDARAKLDAIGIVLKPRVHGNIGNWPGHKIGHYDQFDEFFGQ